MTRRLAIPVVAGIIWGNDGRILISKRPSNTHLAGYWEFPGGKIESGETPAEALIRETEEELGIVVRPIKELTCTLYQYPEKYIELIFLQALFISGIPKRIGVADFAWIYPSEVGNYRFPEADQTLFKTDWNHPPQQHPGN